MRISISNLAWEPPDDHRMAALLNAQGVDAIDVVPGKYFPDLFDAGVDEVEEVREWWLGRGVEIVGMQALLFGTSGLNLFGEPTVRERMLAHLDAVCRIARGLGARRLVFGSPRNRDRAGLTDEDVDRIATAFFRRLGDIALGDELTFCLEPNPTLYGANYMTTSVETAAVVRRTRHPAIRLQLDTGAVQVNGEDIREVVSATADLIGHAHASEPGLVPLGEGGVDHARAGAVLARFRPDVVVTVEMRAPRGPDRFEVIERALQHATRSYYRGSAEDAADQTGASRAP